ncbi:MAG: hypothetical protein NTW96_15415 [Planctomycetia bacterium]|jgi:hypothetical protein|nr:hypothetical protein [Planctomycetia bacterium]
MTKDSRPGQPLYSQIDVSNTTSEGHRPMFQTHVSCGDGEQTRLLREILAAQDRQNELLEELVAQVGAVQRQRMAELGQWKQANPHLARNCREAAEALSKVQTEFLDTLTREISENYDVLLDGDFMLNEFVDRFGPRLAHLNGVLQVLSQLSSTSDAANTHNIP